MSLLSKTQENYIKCIYQLTLHQKRASNSSIAQYLDHKASTVSEQIKNLHQLKLVNYEAYQGVFLEPKGQKIALQLIRQHRVWETFLVEKLNYQWDEVHDLAEELEHIQSTDLIDRLHQFLGQPAYDPHGDPIPNRNLDLPNSDHLFHLAKASPGKTYILQGIKEEDPKLMQHLAAKNLEIGTEITLIKRYDLDASLLLFFNGKEIPLSHKISQQLQVYEKI